MHEKRHGPPKRKKSHSIELDLPLLNSTGDGPTPEAKKVVRVSFETLLSRRMKNLDRPDGWSTHERIIWKAADRVEAIEQEMKVHFDFKPLEINDDTRWKPKVMKDPEAQKKEEEDNKERLRRGIAILNKLSWTNLEKLTVQFLEALGVSSIKETGDGTTEDENNEEVGLCQNLLKDSMSLVLEKAMTEPHFAELYAGFSSKLSVAHTGFRNVLLALCKEKFDEAHKEEEDNMADNESKKAKLQKKKSIGLMRFIGELYKNQLMKGRIMVSCLQLLLCPDDEEKLECYTQLMITIGGRLHQTIEKHASTSPDAKAATVELDNLWRKTYSMAGRPCPRKLVKKDFIGPTAPSNRIKFLLQDLVDLKENDWIPHLRHRQEKAKTIEEIHQEVLREEEEAARKSNANPKRVMRSQSFNQTKSRDMQVKRSNSFNNDAKQSRTPNGTPSRSPEKGGRGRGRGPGRGRGTTRLTKSDSLSTLQSHLIPASPARLSGLPSSPVKRERSLNRSPSETLIDFKIVEYLEPGECGEKMKATLKELFVGGDFHDAVQSVEELVGLFDEGDVARGSAVVEAGVLLVMEMKEKEVATFQTLIEKCLEEDNLPRRSLAQGLREPIEFLRDIEIDAPKAGGFLADIVSSWIKSDKDDDPVTLHKLLECHSAPPKRLDEFAIDVLARRLGEISDRELEVVQRLIAKSGGNQKSNEEIRSWVKERQKILGSLTNRL